jgi:O-antigen ligase
MPSGGHNLRRRVYLLQFAAKTPSTPRCLGVALFAASLYAAFAQGAIRTPNEPRLQVGVAVIAALAAAAWLGFGTLSLGASKPALAALGLLLAFTAWSALTLAWSISPDGTWVEINRLFSYTLILGLAIALGASDVDAIRCTGSGVLALTLIVMAYALAQKIIPGLHIAGLIDLDQTGRDARLQAPLDYWNALALLLVLGAPVALTLALRPTAARALRLAGMVGFELIVVSIGFTESRGGFLALAVAVAATVLLSPDRLSTLVWAAVATAVGALELAVALSAHPLSGDNIALGRRELAGVLLLIILIAGATLSALALPYLDRFGPGLTGVRRRRIWRGLGCAGLALVGLAVLGAALSQRGLAGQISHIWSSFNHADSIADSGATRLFSASSANRVDWWGQALAAFADRPLNGYGSGSFPVINMLFRHDTVSVQDAHSVPLQWLAETGLVGCVLALASWLTLLQQGFRAVRRAGVPAGRVEPIGLDSDAARRRLGAVALLAPALAYSVHALYDWDWDIPGVTLPVLIMLGVLAGSSVRPPPERPAIVTVPAELTTSREISPTVRLAGLGLLTAIVALFAISSVLPGVAATQVDAALAHASAGTPASLARARHEAAEASALDPLSGAGPLASADIAVGENAYPLARDYVIEAIRRQPTDEAAWDTLVSIDLRLNRDAEAIAAAQHALDLDPVSGPVGYLSLASDVIAAAVAAAPPQDSATAIATPGY